MQAARVDEARAVKVEAVLWGNGSVRRRDVGGGVTALEEICVMDQWA